MSDLAPVRATSSALPRARAAACLAAGAVLLPVGGHLLGRLAGAEPRRGPPATARSVPLPV